MLLISLLLASIAWLAISIVRSEEINSAGVVLLEPIVSSISVVLAEVHGFEI